MALLALKNQIPDLVLPEWDPNALSAVVNTRAAATFRPQTASLRYNVVGSSTWACRQEVSACSLLENRIAHALVSRRERGF